MPIPKNLPFPSDPLLWRGMAAALPLGLFAWELDEQRFSLVSPGLPRLLGYEPEECGDDVGGFLESLLFPGERGRLTSRVEAMRLLEPGQPGEVDALLRHRDGSIRCLRAVVGVLLRDDAGRALRIGGACRDLTKRVDDEAALHASEALNRSILESSGDCIKLLSVAGELISMNGPGLRLLEIEDFSVYRNCPWAALWGEGKGEETARAAVAAAAAGLEFRFQAPCKTASGNVKWWDVIVSPVREREGGPVTQLVSISRDITAQREQEESMRRAADHTRNVLDSVAAFVGLLELDGTLLDANRAALLAGGLELADVQGMKFWETPWLNWSEEVQARMRDAMARAATGESVRFDEWVRTAGDQRRLVDVTITPLCDEDGTVTHLIPSGTDITDRHRAEAALREADQHKDAFLAMLAHELRNPLAAVQNALSVSDESPHYSQDAHWARGVIARQTTLLGRMVDDLLDISRISMGKVNLQAVDMDLSVSLRRAAETVVAAVNAKGQRLACHFPPGSIPVHGDSVRLEQAMVNLLTNASRYSPAGKRVQFRAECDEAARVVRIEVRDQGIGIAPEMVARIFELFGQVDTSHDRNAGGLGIGLTLARELVTLHGGTLSVQSDGLNRGSAFTIELPMLKDPLPREEITLKPPPEEAPGKGLRVLIVDDNVDAARGLSRLLTRRGHEVREAADGPSALAEAADFQPHAVLLDIGLPGMDGYGVARHLRGPDGLPGVHIIGISGYARQNDRLLGKEAGFDHHLLKPVEFSEVLRLLALLQLPPAPHV